MRRRFFLLMGAVAAVAPADIRQELVDLFGAMAAALSEGNPAGFLRAIDRSMPDYARFAANVTALSHQNELSSSIEIAKQEGDSDVQVVELDWLLEIRGREQSHIFLRRRTSVKYRLERHMNKWRIVSLDPASFFAPPAP